MNISQQILRFLAGSIGMEVDPDSYIKFSFEQFPKGGMGLILILIIFGLFAFGLLSLKNLSPQKTIKGKIISLIRGIVIILPILIFLNPSLKIIRKETKKGKTLVFMDTSWSMRYTDSRLKKSRIEIVKNLISENKFEFLNLLEKKNKLKLFRFDTHPVVINSENKNEILKLKADGQGTNLSSVLEKTLSEETSGRISAALIFTDGRWNLGENPITYTAPIRKRKIPIFIIGVGYEEKIPNITIFNIKAPEMVFLKDPFEIKVKAKFPKNAKYPKATLYQGKKEIDSKPLSLGNEDSLEVKFTVEPTKKGEFYYTVVLECETQGHQIKESIKTTVEVADVPIKLLMVSGSPNWEFRNLRKLFQRDPTIDLSCWLQSAYAGYPQPGNSPIKHLPEEEKELEKYHVIMLIDPDPEGINLLFSKNIEKLVTKEGMGLIFIAGEKNTLSFFSRTTVETLTGPIVSLLPARSDQEVAEILIGMGKIMDREWKIEPTPEGTVSKLFGLSLTPDEIRRIINSIPGIYWNYPFYKPKPGAHILFTHPGPDPLHRTTKGPRPIALWHNAGAGKVFLLATDETWRWKATAEKFWEMFWVRTVRFVSEGKLFLKKSYHILSTDRKFYEVGSEITITDTPPPEKQPKTINAVILFEGKEICKLELKQYHHVGKEFKGIFTANKPGFYEVKIKGKKKSVPAKFYVVEPYLEREKGVDENFLKEIASKCGGQYFNITKAKNIPNLIESIYETILFESRPKPIWDNWVLLGFFVLLLTIEWVIRKFVNLP